MEKYVLPRSEPAHAASPSWGFVHVNDLRAQKETSCRCQPVNIRLLPSYRRRRSIHQCALMDNGNYNDDSATMDLAASPGVRRVKLQSLAGESPLSECLVCSMYYAWRGLKLASVCLTPNTQLDQHFAVYRRSILFDV